MATRSCCATTVVPWVGTRTLKSASDRGHPGPSMRPVAQAGTATVSSTYER